MCAVVCCVCGSEVLMVFFFKQKTAYEWRISDWSSDVCSSDLTGGGEGRGRAAALAAGNRREDAGAPAAHPARRAAVHRPDQRAAAAVAQRARARRHRCQDRKSVVSGKSVSVRVALGGRRIIKKKNKQQQQYK